MKNCDFKNNYSDGANNDFGSNGGAIYNGNSDLFLYNCRFEDNGLTGWNNFDPNESIFNGGILSLNACSFSAKDEGYFIFNMGHLIIKGVNLDNEDLIRNNGSLKIIKN